MSRVVTTAAVNEARDRHYAYNPVSGLHERTLLLEGSSTNLCLQSEDFANASWSKVGTPVTTSAAVPASVMGVSLDLLEDDDAAALEGYIQTVTFTADGTKAVSLFVKQGTSTSSLIQLYDTTAATARMSAVLTWSSGVPSLTMGTGTLQDTPREIANGVYRLRFICPSVVAANTNRVAVYPATTAGGATANTGTLYAGGVQPENNAFCTSYTKTTTATVTRSADACTVPLPSGLSVPQALTVYVKFIEMGTISTTAARVLQIGSASNPRLLLNENAGKYSIQHLTGAGSATGSAAAAPALGDQVELRGVLYADGSVLLGQSINAAAEANSARSAGLALQTAWSAATMALGSQAGSAAFGFAGFLSVKLARGERTMAEMRSL